MAGIVSRAWSDTIKGAGGPPGVLFLLAGPLVGWAILGGLYGKPIMEAETQYLVTGLAGVGAVFLLMLTYSLIAAPYRIQRDRADAAERRVHEVEAAKPLAIVVEPPKASVQSTPLKTDHVPERGYYHEGTVWVVSPFAVNALVVEVIYDGSVVIDVSVTRSGFNSQSHEGNAERILVKCKQPGNDVYTVLINTKTAVVPRVLYSVE